MPNTRIEGHCLCRGVVYEYGGEPNWTVHCHCDSCRRATSSPFTTWISVPRASFRFKAGVPRYFQSSPGVRRGFCEACGSPLTYENEIIPDEVHLYAVSLADPSHVRPTAHVFVAEQLPWFETQDDLPRYAATRRGGAAPIRVGPRVRPLA
ncbi:MAG: GFA family protein [Rhodospirillaceae bacterium]|nr:GFA family protein [Rhodospirillaceae bacterium]